MKISIITVAYNNLSGLKNTVESTLDFVEKLNFETELVVIDGGSKDGTKDYLHEISLQCKQISNFQFVSEPDLGIYYAMNKGIKMSSGTYLIFMNSGDFFDLKNVDAFKQVFLDNYYKNVDIIVFGISSVANGKSIRIKKFTSVGSLKDFPSIPHQSTLIKRELLVDRGYNVGFRILADYDSFCDFFAQGKVFANYPNIDIAVFEQGGTSTKRESILALVSELKKIQRFYFNRISLKAIFNFYIKYIILSLPFSKKIEVIGRFLVSNKGKVK